MVKYCPVCECEFDEEMLVCHKDKVALKKEKPKTQDLILSEIYAVRTNIEAKKIILDLQDHNILAQENSLSISQLPVFTDMDYIISVESSQVQEAIALIKKAQQDGVISEYGDFMLE